MIRLPAPTVAWHLQAADLRIWHDGDIDRLRAWVATLDGPSAPAGTPFRDRFAYGYPIPDHFDHRR